MEIWKDISEYEVYYQVSNLGRIKRLKTFVKNKHGERLCRERILKPVIDKDGYHIYTFSVKSIMKKARCHVVVYNSFVGEVDLGNVVDHKDNIKSNNSLENLQSITHRENCIKDKENSNSTGIKFSKYNKWVVSIRINTNKVFIGSFSKKEDALLARGLAINNQCLFKNAKQYRDMIYLMVKK